MSTTDDFSNYPESLQDKKAKSAKERSPRDALISVLRRIDSGEISPDALLILYTTYDKKGEETGGGFESAGGKTGHHVLGMLEAFKFRFMVGGLVVE